MTGNRAGTRPALVSPRVEALMFQLGSSQDWTLYNLYLCHFLSTWNARSYEFASVHLHRRCVSGRSQCGFVDVGLDRHPVLVAFFVTTSRRGITTSLGIIVFASSLGRWVDRAPSRLRTLLTTVSVNRVVVIAACVCWAAIITKDSTQRRA